MPKLQNMSMIIRIIFGVLMAGIMIGLLWFDATFEPAGLPMTVLVLGLVVVAFIEMRRLLQTRGVEILWLSGAAGAALLATSPFWWSYLADFLALPSSTPDGLQIFLLIALLLAAIFLEQMFQDAPETSLLRVAGTVLAMLYLGVGGAMVLKIRIAHGEAMIILFLATVKLTDVGAYFTGSLIGRHKLIPKLSPKKTWEGLIGGLTTAAVAAILLPMLLGRVHPDVTPHWAWWQAAIFGVLMGITGQFGDLCESLLKRSAHVKDSGAVVPEFGGVLDIVDSLLFSAPVALMFLWFME
jgi:phosphatidate cytidylyltransferase